MTPPTITYRGMPHSPAMDEKINVYAAKLLEFQPKVTTCHVIVDEADRRKRKGGLFEVRVDVHVPGREIVASHQEHADPYVAAHEAFQAVYRQLEEDVQRRRRHVKRHEDLSGDLPSP
jgi:ribosomal subunit interface protein